MIDRKLISKPSIQWLIFLLICLGAIFIVFGRSLNVFFWQDDFNLLEFVIHKPLEEYIRISFTPPTELLPMNLGVVFRPIPHYLYFHGNYLLFGLNPVPYRLVNLLLHLVNAFLMARYTQLLFGQRSIGFIAGLLLIVNRVFTIPLYWISANNEIIMVSFVLISIITYIFQLNNNSYKKFVYLAISILSTFCALMSKETGVIIPSLIVLNVFLRFEDKPFSWRNKIRDCLLLWPHILMCIIFVIMRAPLILYAFQGGGDSYYTVSSPLSNVTNGLMWGFWWNIETFVEPWRQILDSITQSFSLFQPIYLSLLVFCLSIIGGIWIIRSKKQLREANPIWLGLIWFFISAIPALITGILADYLFALPAVGFSIMAAYYLKFISERIFRSNSKRNIFIGFALILATLSAWLVVPQAEKATGVAEDMPLIFQTIELVKSHGSELDQEKMLCLIDTNEFWLPHRAEAALHVFVDPQITVTEIRDVTTVCPTNTLTLEYKDGNVIRNPA